LARGARALQVTAQQQEELAEEEAEKHGECYPRDNRRVRSPLHRTSVHAARRRATRPAGTVLLPRASVCNLAAGVAKYAARQMVSLPGASASAEAAALAQDGPGPRPPPLPGATLRPARASPAPALNAVDIEP
jgi:hypothetical protein